MGRRLLVGTGVLAALATIAYGLAMAMGIVSGDAIWAVIAEARPPIVVGLIHSAPGRWRSARSRCSTPRSWR